MVQPLTVNKFGQAAQSEEASPFSQGRYNIGYTGVVEKKEEFKATMRKLGKSISIMGQFDKQKSTKETSPLYDTSFCQMIQEHMFKNAWLMLWLLEDGMDIERGKAGGRWKWKTTIIK